MDGFRFDALSRSLVAGQSRRGLARLLAGFALGGPLALLGLGETEAKRRKRKRKKKKRGDQGSTGTGPPPGPPGPTCSDGIQNGTETGVDCGGPSCPRCPAGQPCTSREDCVTARCTNGTCTICTAHTQCGSDVHGDCNCQSATTGMCTTSATGTFVDACSTCPAGWHCQGIPGAPTPTFGCFAPCGSGANCGSRDACEGATGECGRGGKCFQPLGGGSTQCGVPPDPGLCGCTSHQQCAATFGAGAFCVTFTADSNSCSCSPDPTVPKTFCVRPA